MPVLSVAETTTAHGTLAAMQLARGPMTKRSVSLGFAALAWCCACSGSSGSSGSKGTGGSASEDSGAPSDDGGASQAGASQAGASNGKGGGAGSCAVGECFVANTCLDHCGGTAVYVGCCECVPPAVNQSSCASGN